MTQQVKVLNKNGFEIVDYFDGIAYKFKPNEAVNIPPEAARHIFGVEFPADADECNSEEFRAQVFAHLQKRWGWNPANPEKLEKTLVLFKNLTFTPVIFKLVESEAKKELPEPREQKNHVKGATFKHREAEGAA